MENTFYKTVKEGEVLSIWGYKDGVLTCYDIENLRKKRFSEGIQLKLLIELLDTPICKNEFLDLKNIWKTRCNEDLEYSPSEVYTDATTGVTFEELCNFEIDEFEIIEKFNPKTEYQLYNVDGSIQIYGFSERDSNELVEFFESNGFESGFKVLGKNGQVKGYVHPDLFKILSYHLKTL